LALFAGVGVAHYVIGLASGPMLILANP
jgi:hypothetical protein